MTTALEQVLAFQQVFGAPRESIRTALIAMAKDAYVRGDAGIDYLEATVTAILRDEPIAILQPGERVLRAHAR